jgi:hypothetical protein
MLSTCRLAAETPPTSQSTSMAPCGFLARTQSLVGRMLHRTVVRLVVTARRHHCPLVWVEKPLSPIRFPAWRSCSARRETEWPTSWTPRRPVAARTDRIRCQASSKRDRGKKMCLKQTRRAPTPCTGCFHRSRNHTWDSFLSRRALLFLLRSLVLQRSFLMLVAVAR